MSSARPRSRTRDIRNEKEPPVPAPAALIGAPCWIDLYTSDPDRSRAFYGELFGWASAATGPEYGGYINFTKDGLAVAGAMHNDGQSGTPDLWSIYLATDDAKKTIDTAANAGGQVIVPPMDVGELGTMALLTDVGGAAIGAWKPALHKGFGVIDEPNTPGWFELHTRNFGESLDFYRDVFRWDVHVMSDTPDFRYATLGEEENARAGVMDATGFLPEGVPAHWSVYFRVASADAAIERAVGLGATTVVPAEDTPYGRLATLTDPTGAAFKFVGSA
jgi:predicted enzyme related to lactoylglutathione lyase